MNRRVAFIYRRKNPLFFSIENVFDIINSEIQRRGIEVKKIEVPHYSSGIIAIIKNIVFLRKWRYSMYHITGDIHYAVFAYPRRKTVLTIHDCVFIHQSKGLKKLLMNWIFLKGPVMFAHRVTTISEASKNEIIKFSGCDPSKVVVIPDPLGSHIKFSPYHFNSDKPVLLFIGSTPNKNLPRVIEALKGIQCHLDIVGNIPDEQLIQLKEAAVSYSQSERLSEEALNQKFALADILLFPTLFEGFGLPILEAQQAGRPVLTSDLAPMNWVAGSGACLVDPTNVESIREGILKLLSEEAYRKELIMNGLINLERFSPKIISEQYLNIYESMN